MGCSKRSSYNEAGAPSEYDRVCWRWTCMVPPHAGPRLASSGFDQLVLKVVSSFARGRRCSSSSTGTSFIVSPSLNPIMYFYRVRKGDLKSCLWIARVSGQISLAMSAAERRVPLAGGRSFYGISYTTSSSAIPRSDARCRTGSRLLVLRIDEEPGCSTTGPVAKIERVAARP